VFKPERRSKMVLSVKKIPAKQYPWNNLPFRYVFIYYGHGLPVLSHHETTEFQSITSNTVVNATGL